MNIRRMKQTLQVGDLQWSHPTGFDDGIDQMVIVDTLDEKAKRGTRTRWVRFGPRAKTAVPFLHDYHEEVFLVSGAQSVLDEKTATVREFYSAGAYFVRPAGTRHGPFSSEDGCVLLEFHYY